MSHVSRQRSKLYLLKEARHVNLISGRTHLGQFRKSCRMLLKCTVGRVRGSSAPRHITKAARRRDQPATALARGSRARSMVVSIMRSSLARSSSLWSSEEGGEKEEESVEEEEKQEENDENARGVPATRDVGGADDDAETNDEKNAAAPPLAATGNTTTGGCL